MLKNTKFYVALALLVQAVASLVAFVVLAVKKKAMAAAFLAVGGVSGVAGAYLMGQCIEEEQDFEEYCDGDCENCAELEECEALEDALEEAEAEAEEVEVEEEDFDLNAGEPFARDAENKDI
ncbi:MAG: hypothetical protein IJX55_00670 [Clostridia bacterium]|nr:hypothetical protein [Clostridia bacterium]